MQGIFIASSRTVSHKNLYYTILAENEKSCKLILYSVRWHYPTYYYVELRNCPFGFVFSPVAKSCICEPILTTCGIIGDHNCDINDQTILRPANSWISATTHNNSYTYHVSLHCPFHYCLPHSSHLNFSTPNVSLTDLVSVWTLSTRSQYCL